MAINRVIDYVTSGEEKYANLFLVDILLRAIWCTIFKGKVIPYLMPSYGDARRIDLLIF